MDERKYTADEITEALVRCERQQCEKCPFRPDMDCISNLRLEALGIIDLQRKKIKSLEKVLNELKMEAEMVYKQRDAQKNRADSIAKFARAEAIKEFAKMLKLKFRIKYTHSKPCEDLIDALVKETTEDQNES